jgi:TetR/AcrR family transcriptional regulator, regulator of cefoperazone and chloramphenicol sensitivity
MKGRVGQVGQVGRVTRVSDATRDRLLDVATGLFAENGFKRVTVRQIAESARANVAAVNYHFGDKQGLYDTIVDTVIAAMKATNEAAFEAGRELSPEEQLRAFVHVWLSQVTRSPRHLWIHRLLNRELEEPTGALERVFKEVIEPRNEHLAAIVSRLTGLSQRDPRILRAIVSVLGQCLIFARPVPVRAPARWQGIARDVDAVADHITEFSLAGLRAMRD